MTLKQFVTTHEGKLKRGAISRVSEYLGVSFNCVKRWLSGDWKPGIETHRKIQNMIQSRIDLSPRAHVSAHPKKKSKVRKPVRRGNLRVSAN